MLRKTYYDLDLFYEGEESSDTAMNLAVTYSERGQNEYTLEQTPSISKW
ncbi:hypothetical protein Back11_05620 [Paenibacillus baekrokdamisoli]|uniref:Uncharacterized protein n=1 Tax=Paenibacillus baekrokdamisoli TaxID=1712516 RepID=A0A3G9IJN4_9BACL|nr:hypothetical protein [Paenibacillus baekrokdamisoli]MBB3067596.1 hypothetical protein [Paenibacillus baekrokdamisoli]BBH19217.1 hypothetical protein Back11_05620 [Paenibacillus baekrokdamisoli]